MSPWVQYLIFLLKSVTAAVVILFVVAGFFTLLRKAKEHPKQKLNIRPLNKTYDAFSEVLNKELMNQAEYKKYRKSEKKRRKEAPSQSTKRLFVIDFQGDIRCSAVNNLREIITALLQVAQPQDEVLLKLESGGGMIAPYGLAASQLERLKQQSKGRRQRWLSDGVRRRSNLSSTVCDYWLDWCRRAITELSSLSQKT
ncbi:inner membrane peptidase [Rickettsiella massiliensis]|uniref:inner membrane peptidase n=1 Tax=Rickettsiella massiliensis TaxID=676517 RepID=UPI00029A2761|nr:inner membrane peptidase [Rickettsiella massiliensis]